MTIVRVVRYGGLTYYLFRDLERHLYHLTYDARLVKERMNIPSGAYWVPMKQRRSRLILALLEPHLRPGALVLADNADWSQEYLARVRSPAEGYLSVPFADDVELSMRIG